MGKVIAVFSLVMVFEIAEAIACSCIDMPTSQAYEAADIIFVGVVLDRELPFRPHVVDGDTLSAEMVWSHDMVRHTFSVLDVWKGEVPDSLQVYSAREGASCGFDFVVGVRYLVYGRTVEQSNYRHGRTTPPPVWAGDPMFPVIVASMCSGTKLPSEADLDAQYHREREAAAVESRSSMNPD